MRLLAFSDLHRDQAAARAIVQRAGDVDVVVAAGDFAVKRVGIEDVVDILKEIDRPTVLVPGNGESDSELRAACRRWSTAHVLHGSGVTIDGVEFFGIGAGIPATPFGSWSFDLTEQEAQRMLAACPRDAVLVSHSPPYGHVDGVGETHLGSPTPCSTPSSESNPVWSCADTSTGVGGSAPESDPRRSSMSARRATSSRSEQGYGEEERQPDNAQSDC